MGINELLKGKREEIFRLAKKHGMKNLRIFGSVARGEAGPNSDIDFLVELEEKRTYFDLVGFWQDLEEFLGKKVDVITDGGISPYLRNKILAEAIAL